MPGFHFTSHCCYGNLLHTLTGTVSFAPDDLNGRRSVQMALNPAARRRKRTVSGTHLESWDSSNQIQACIGRHRLVKLVRATVDGSQNCLVCSGLAWLTASKVEKNKEEKTGKLTSFFVRPKVTYSTQRWERGMSPFF